MFDRTPILNTTFSGVKGLNSENWVEKSAPLKMELWKKLLILILELKTDLDVSKRQEKLLKSTKIGRKPESEGNKEKIVPTTEQNSSKMEVDKRFKSSTHGKNFGSNGKAILHSEVANVCTVDFSSELPAFPFNSVIKENTSNSQNLVHRMNLNSVAHKYNMRGENLKSCITLQTHFKSYNKCHICHKILSRSSNLPRHIRTHLGERLFKCELCLKAFSSKSILEFHLRKHLGEEAHQCKWCKSNFVSKAGLDVHILRKHTHDKPFSCLFCAKREISQYNLYTHIRTHTNEKPFACCTCSKEFTTIDYLNRHRKRLNH